MQALEALKTLRSGLPLAIPWVALAAVVVPAPASDDPTALKLDELTEKYFLLRKVK